MPRLTRIRRIIGVLEQMLEIVRARTVSGPATDDQEVVAARRQRRHIEWLCDHDINAFRVYTRADLAHARVLPLSLVPSSLTWGFRNVDNATLYYGSQPLVFYMPAVVTYIVFEERTPELVLDLAPLALHDVLALDLLASFASDEDAGFPRSIYVSTGFADGEILPVHDVATGIPRGNIDWSDVFVDDYILAEVSVKRVFTGDRAWFLRYELVAATRVATTW